MSALGQRLSRRLRRWWPSTLSGQLLAIQVVIVSVVFLGVAAMSVAQQDLGAQERESARARAIAEQLSQYPGIRSVVGPDGQGYLSQAVSEAETGRDLSGSSAVLILDAARRVLVRTEGAPDVSPLLWTSEAFAGRSWMAYLDPYSVAMVPIINHETRATDGVIAVVRSHPSVWDDLASALPNLLTYLGLASLIGIIGSLLLARRVKRQTLGLEPREIAGLVEQREAVLHGIKEGLLAVDLNGRITLVNSGAATLLAIPQAGVVGRTLDEIEPAGSLRGLFPVRSRLGRPAPGPAAAEMADTDRVLVVAGRLVTANVMPVRQHGRLVGHVATLRDRTELLELQRELDRTRTTTDSLRAQAHEFSNRLHVVAGLIDLAEYDDVRDYIRRISADEAELTARVTSAVGDPAVGAMLMAKSRQAGERGIRLIIDPTTRLGRLPGELSTDLNTVLGNLVDNAMDAAPGTGAVVRVTLTESPERIVLVVRDNGPGIPEDSLDEVFTRGFSTKTAAPGSSRGIGLALVRMVVQQRGGEVSVANDDGAVFTVVLPTP